MIQKPMDILTLFPVRKSKRQKRAFREAVQKYFEDLGYPCAVEKGSFGSRNIIAGDPEKARYLITAHYDTCAHLPFPNLITPCNFWLFLLYQLFVTALIFGVAVVIGVIAGLVLQDPGTAGATAYIALWVFLILIMVGPANRHNANDKTSGVVTVLETARALQPEKREDVCFVLFDLEEAGLIGSASYRSSHKKQIDAQVLLNLDCVGEGDNIVLFPAKKLRADTGRMKWLRSCCRSSGKKTVSVRGKGFSYYPSDQANFPLGVGIAAFRTSKWAGLYLGKIHTNRDTILEEENIHILCRCMTDLVGSDTVQ